MHSFSVNIRIYQSLGEHHFRGLTNPDVNQKRMHQLCCYMTLSFFPSFISSLFIFINLLKTDVPSALKNILQLFFKFLKPLRDMQIKLYF